MVKFLVNKQFQDIHTGKQYEKGKTYDFTLKRAEEVKQNLDNSYLTRNDDKQK